MAELRLRCDTYSDPSVMKINIKMNGGDGQDKISAELTKLFYESHKEEIDEVKNLYLIERESVQKRKDILKRLRDDEMIEFSKQVKETQPELFI